ncbi:MAG: hypothetical protein RL736_17 [Pseudomonadota bacterium]|jgi:hypothetical protein
MANTKNVKFPEPEMIEGSVKYNNSIEVKASRGESTSSMRRNRSTTISRTDKYSNIEGGVIPFTYGGGHGRYNSNISIRDTIILCQKAYYNFSIFRNTIDLMTEFSCSPIYFTGGNEQSRKFFQAWGDRVNLWKLQDMFFREFYRSGNVFLYKLNAAFTKQDMRVISDLITTEARAGEVPIRYIVLNPADIQAIGSASFISPKYIKILNDFEMQVLTNPSSEEDKALSMRVKNIKDLQDKTNISMTNQYMVFELEPERFIPVFYKKQDYEPFAIPMGFPVLEDINWKQELKNMDMAISRTIQQTVLLVTMGNDEIGMPTKEQIGTLRKIFENESVGRILVTDYTTNIKFIIPEIGQILDPRKYEVVDRDIRYGLNNVLFGEEKYANTSTKIEVFLSRLKHARETFMNEFLIPEMKKISKDLGFKNIPTPRFKDADFKSDVNLTRTYSRLIELGVLTPEEGLTAIDTGRLPLPDESIKSQKEFIKLQDEDGLYRPLLNKPQIGAGASAAPTGRPAGTGTPQTTKTPGKIGVKASEEKPKVNADLVAKNLIKFDQLVESVGTYLKEKYSRKNLSKEQKDIIKTVAETIATNENPKDWSNKIENYINKPVEITVNMNEIQAIAEEYGVDYKTAILLYHSRIE